MARVIISVAHDNQGVWQHTDELLFNRIEVRRLFNSTPIDTLNTHLNRFDVGNLDSLPKCGWTFHLWEVPDAILHSTMQAIEQHHNDPSGKVRDKGFIQTVEPDQWMGVASSTPPVPITDVGTGFSLSSWHSTHYAPMMGISTAHNNSIKGDQVRIAIIDSGIEDQALQNANSFTYSPTWKDLWDQNNSGIPEDKSGHGTAMATIIDAVAPEASLFIIRVMDKSRARLWDFMAGVTTAILDYDVHLINCSLGFTHIYPCQVCGKGWIPRSKILEDFIDAMGFVA